MIYIDRMQVGPDDPKADKWQKDTKDKESILVLRYKNLLVR